MKVLITCPPMLKKINDLRHYFNEKNIELIIPNVVQVLAEDELVKLVPQVDGWIIGDDPATARVFKAGKAGKLKAAVKWGVGVDNVDFKACDELGIPIINTPNVFGGEVADLAIAYLLGLARNSYFIDREVRKGNWVKPTGISVNGKTVAVVGLGDIGQSTIKRLKGFDVNIIAYDPYSKFTSSDLGIEAIHSFPDRLESADFIILTCALTKSSFHLINGESINSMKNNVKIINVSRGQLINEVDLIEGLETGKIASVALDVFEEEPLNLNNKLVNYPNCIFGSHNGSNTHEAVTRASEIAISHLFNFLEV